MICGFFFTIYVKIIKINLLEWITLKTIWQLFITFFKIGAFTFGGGYAMIPLIEFEIVEKRKWIKEREIVDILALAQSLPGAIAINSSTFVGYRIAGVRGALAATLGVILPSFLIILFISGFLIKYGNSKILGDFFKGINAVVVALILVALYKLVKPSIEDRLGWVLAITGFIVLFYFNFHPILVIILAGITGIIARAIGNKVYLKE